jgi:uncharacterized membrane protein YeaQ/YmgE (transglycosylase-associated protein family)
MKITDKQKRVAGYLAYLFACVLGAIILAGAASGCSVQPVDSVTGAKVGDPVSVFKPHPTTNPETGNPIILKGTGKIDPDAAADAVEVGNQVVQTTAPAFGPWGSAVAGVVGAATLLIVAKLRKKKQTQ